MTTRILYVLVAVALLATSCGGDDFENAVASQQGSAESAESTQAPQSAEAPTAPAAEPTSEPASDPEPQPDTAVASPVRLRETPQYQILETAEGQTLYGYISDAIAQAPSCPTDGPEICEAYRPLLSTTGSTLPPGLDPNQFMLFETAEGFHIIYTANKAAWGIPLYTWADEGPSEYQGLSASYSADVVTADGKLGTDFEAPGS